MHRSNMNTNVPKPCVISLPDSPCPRPMSHALGPLVDVSSLASFPYAQNLRENQVVQQNVSNTARRMLESTPLVLSIECDDNKLFVVFEKGCKRPKTTSHYRFHHSVHCNVTGCLMEAQVSQKSLSSKRSSRWHFYRIIKS